VLFEIETTFLISLLTLMILLILRALTKLVDVPNWNFSGVSGAVGYASVYNNFFASQTSVSKVGITGIQHNFSVSGCKLSGTALNELYASLAVVGASGSAAKTITVTGNWGASAALGHNPVIAISKGWTVTI